MAAGTTLQIKRKATPFVALDLAIGELGLDTSTGDLYASLDGLTVFIIAASAIADAVADYLPLAGGTMIGDIDMGSFDIKGALNIYADTYYSGSPALPIAAVLGSGADFQAADASNINRVYASYLRGVLEDGASVTAVDPTLRELRASDGTTIVLRWAIPGYLDTDGVGIRTAGDGYFANWDGGAYVLSLDWANRALYGTDGTTMAFRWDNLTGDLVSASGASQLNIANGTLTDNVSASVQWINHKLTNTGAISGAYGDSLNWNTRQLLGSDGTTVALDWSNGTSRFASDGSGGYYYWIDSAGFHGPIGSWNGDTFTGAQSFPDGLSSVSGTDSSLMEPTYVSVSNSLAAADVSVFHNYISFGNNAFAGQILPPALTANRSWNLPDADGTFALLTDLSAYLPIAGNAGDDMTGDLHMGAANIVGGGVVGAVVDMDDGRLLSGTSLNSVDWITRQLFASDGTTVMLDWSDANDLYVSGQNVHLYATYASYGYLNGTTAAPTAAFFPAGATMGSTLAMGGFDINMGSGTINNINGLGGHNVPGGGSTLALISDLSAYVPYTGATADIDLGIYYILAEQGQFDTITDYAGSGTPTFTYGVNTVTGQGYTTNGGIAYFPYGAEFNGAGLSSIGSITSTGKVSNTKVDVTLGETATTLAITNNFVKLTGDAGANTITTITGGVSGQELTILFVDGLVTLTDTNAATTDTLDLAAPFVSTARATIKFIHDGTKWIETSRSQETPAVRLWNPTTSSYYVLTVSGTATNEILSVDPE